MIVESYYKCKDATNRSRQKKKRAVLLVWVSVAYSITAISKSPNKIDKQPNYNSKSAGDLGSGDERNA